MQYHVPLPGTLGVQVRVAVLMRIGGLCSACATHNPTSRRQRATVPQLVGGAGHQQAAWVQAVPWQHEGYLSLTNVVYQVNVSRHYRLPRPDLAQSRCLKCTCWWCSPTIADRRGRRRPRRVRLQSATRGKLMAHDMLVDLLANFLRACRFRNVSPGIASCTKRLIALDMN